jgi:hypothetical protein
MLSPRVTRAHRGGRPDCSDRLGTADSGRSRRPMRASGRQHNTGHYAIHVRIASAPHRLALLACFIFSLTCRAEMVRSRRSVKKNRFRLASGAAKRRPSRLPALAACQPPRKRPRPPPRARQIRLDGLLSRARTSEIKSVLTYFWPNNNEIISLELTSAARFSVARI